jgi:steroid 5-alpha reductase family enzyme
MNVLWVYLFAVVLFNLFMFVPAYLYKTDKLTDISYALSFIFLSGFAYIKSSTTGAHILLTLLVFWWALRLGAFLLYRVSKKGKDVRFDGMRENPLKFIRFWLLQGVTVFLVLIGVLLFMEVKSPKVNLLSIFGVIVFLCGLAIEAIADLQKWQFSQNIKNKGKWIEIGLWGRSRHPNYLGEMLVWIGIYLYILPSLTGNDWLIALISPAYIIILLMFVSGIPLLEKSADKKWGNEKGYKEYKKRVPKLIPKL